MEARYGKDGQTLATTAMLKEEDEARRFLEKTGLPYLAVGHHGSMIQSGAAPHFHSK